MSTSQVDLSRPVYWLAYAKSTSYIQPYTILMHLESPVKLLASLMSTISQTGSELPKVKIVGWIFVSIEACRMGERIYLYSYYESR